MKNSIFFFQLGLFLLAFKVDGQNLATNSKSHVKSSSEYQADNAAVIDKGSIYSVASFPYSQTGYITYRIPMDYKEAVIIISNSNGTMLKKYAIIEGGEGFIIIFGGTLPPGLYYYSLQINGEQVESKKLLLSNRL